MTRLNTRALSSIVVTLVLCATSCVSAEQYSYQLDETFRIYHGGQLVAETDSTYVRESSLAFTWGDNEWLIAPPHHCYIKQTNQFFTDLEWAYTNEYGIVLKYKTHFELLDRELRTKTLDMVQNSYRCFTIMPVAIDGFAMSLEGDDGYALQTKDEFFLLWGGYECFDGGVVFKNKDAEIVVLRNDGSRSVLGMRGVFDGAGEYLWVTNTDGITLLDSNLTPVFFQEGYFSPLSIFVDGKAILMDRASAARYLFDVDTRTLTEITDTKLSNSEILYGRRVFTARTF